MCGIIAYAGQQARSNTILLEGLRALEYRGYDSAGLASVINGRIQVIKAKGKVSDLQDALAAAHAQSGTVGIAHTRWATHGEPNECNAHPHTNGIVTLVHNGIIENCQELKAELIQKGYSFHSDTDSEVAAAVINEAYQRCKDKQKTLAYAYTQLKGSFAFAILFADDPNSIYAMRKNSPLIIGIGTNETFIASDISAFLSYTNRYIELKHDEIAKVDERGAIIKTLDGDFIQKTIKKSDIQAHDITKGDFPHYMLKEIHEESHVITRLLERYMPHGVNDLMQTMDDFANIEEIHIVACGSAMYAGMIAKVLLEQKVRIRTICEVASEYRYANPLFHPHLLVVLISQSGETADTIAAMRLAKEHGVKTLALVNNRESTMAREADLFYEILAGKEISVATTKAYCGQVAWMALFAIKFALMRHQLNETEITVIQQELSQLSSQMEQLIHAPHYKAIAAAIAPYSDCYFIGRGLDYALSLEGALKLKEISYIHAEAYGAGEMKHGTISLITQGTPVIAIATDAALLDKTISNIKEVKARGAHVILIAADHLPVDKAVADEAIIVPHLNPFLQGITTIIPLQLIAYETAVQRGCEIDQPRNLAKSVTVE